MAAARICGSCILFCGNRAYSQEGYDLCHNQSLPTVPDFDDVIGGMICVCSHTNKPKKFEQSVWETELAASIPRI